MKKNNQLLGELKALRDTIQIRPIEAAALVNAGQERKTETDYRQSLISKVQLLNLQDQDMDERKTRQVMRHMGDFKIKGKLENVILRQCIKKWKEYADFVREETDKDVKEPQFGNLLQMKDVKKMTASDVFIKPDDGVIFNSKDARGHSKKDGTKVNTSTKIPGKDLKRFLPYCNDVITITIQNLKEHQKKK